MILADENIHSFIIKSLRDSGIEVFSIQESAQGITDEQVIELAKKYDCPILTEDKDFGEWIFSHHAKGFDVIFLRYEFQDFNDIAKALIFFLNSQTPERHFFATITTKKLRLRQL